MKSKKKNHKNAPEQEITRLVRDSLYFHGINKAAEFSLGLSLVQFHLLSTLQHMPGCSPHALAEALNIHPSTITQTLKRLSKKGALYSAPDPRDSRKKILSLTAGGHEMIGTFSLGIGNLLRNQRHSRKPTRPGHHPVV